MKTFQELKKLSRQTSGEMPHLKVAILGDSATQLLCTAIKGMAKLHNFDVSIFEADYSQIELQVLNPDSAYHAFEPDFTIIFQSTNKLLEKYNSDAHHSHSDLAQERMAQIDALASAACGKLIYFDYPEIDDNVFGSYGLKVESSFIYQLRKLNLLLCEYASTHAGFYLCAISDIQNRFGRKFMFDAAIYTSTEMVLSINALPYVAAKVCDIISAIKGKFKKCLILDLDNTLWGGVVGDDGWEGIQIGHSIGIGKAFSEFQAWIKQLKNRGIILAVCSKNDEQVVREAFTRNPEMVLTLDDFAMIVANWENKADNIRYIQQTLNIGFDSMVFVDDNPFERDIVRSNIEGITVPDMPEDPADYLEFLYGCNLFEAAAYSSEDAARTKQYQIQASRAMERMKFTNVDDFLESLEMKAKVEPFNSFNTPRVAQLTQRSNQFNLRTARYDEEDIRRICADSRYATFAFYLSDKYGDNGLISVVILKKEADDSSLFVDTWLMSCRVLNRGMEHFVLNAICDYASQNGFNRIIGEYIPSAKNKIVAQHYSSLGFCETAEANKYVLNINDYIKHNNHIVSENDSD